MNINIIINILIRNMFGYEFSSIIVQKSTRNQVLLHCGYEWTSRVRVDLVTSLSGYELTRNRRRNTVTYEGTVRRMRLMFVFSIFLTTLLCWFLFSIFSIKVFWKCVHWMVLLHRWSMWRMVLLFFTCYRGEGLFILCCQPTHSCFLKTLRA